MYISHQDDGYLWINHCNNMRTCHDPLPLCECVRADMPQEDAGHGLKARFG